uniref:Saposin B-type domain-containing protein n=1 Tax=Panagrellus redivivus TaxID=6233 RepID=A0A7E5A1T6_PANRE
MARYHNLVVLLCFALLITQSQSTPVSKKLISCHDCLYVVRQLELVVKTGGLAAIEPEIEIACLAADVADPLCVFSFMAVFALLENLLSQGLPPRQICEAITFC